MFDLTPDQLLGKPTLHLPMNFIVQKMGDDGKVIGVFQTTDGNQLLMDSKMTHQLILGDVFIRPRLVFESNRFRGHGINGLTTCGFAEIENWTDGLIFDRNGEFQKR